MDVAKRRVVLVGNPNTGKSTLFNALSGLTARTGNYAGVTIEKKIGRMEGTATPIELVDFAGYLFAQSTVAGRTRGRQCAGGECSWRAGPGSDRLWS